MAKEKLNLEEELGVVKFRKLRKISAEIDALGLQVNDSFYKGELTKSLLKLEKKVGELKALLGV